MTLTTPLQLLCQEGAPRDAYGPGSFSYQWLSNGVPIPGATGDTLAVSDVVVPTNAVSHGSFETPFLGESNLTVLTFSAGQTFGGWTVASNTVDLVGTLWQAADGVQSVDMSGTSAGAIYQDVATVPGQQYYLHFALAGNPSGGQTIKTNQVWWNGSLLDTVTFNITGHSVTAMGWTNLEYLVTATGTTTRVQFVSLNSGDYGPALDQVILEAVPPPPADYSVIISNAYGSVTSAVAQVEFDIDGNGLPDSWERTYFGSIGQNPNADSDADGVSNGQEYQDGTDPTNPASFSPSLNLLATPGGLVTVSPVQQNYALGDPVQITAIPDPGNFFVFWSGNLVSANPTENLVMESNMTITAVFGLGLTNGGNATGTIPVGGTNFYDFTANAGDSINLRIGSSGFDGVLYLYGPDGALLSDAVAASTDQLIAYTATNSGTFTVIVSSYSASGTGTYVLHLAQMPEPFIVPVGDEGGPLANGADATGTITLGDLDMWSFTANAGDSINLRIGTSGFNGRLQLYGPNGALLGTAQNSTDDLIAYTATNNGTFTVLVSSYSAGGTGTYVLHLAQMPEPFIVPAGDEGGPLTNGADATGTITLGDLDMWSFTGNAGDSINLGLGTSGFNGSLQLYGPNGALLATGQNSTADLITYTATNSGSFTVLVSAYNSGGTGTYVLNLAQMPEPFIVPTGDQGGPMTNGALYQGTITIGDLDTWSFTANAGDSVVVRVGALTGSYFNPWLRVYGPDGTLLGSVDSGSGIASEIALTATNSGTFTVLVSDGSQDGYGNTGTYQLNYVDAAQSFVVSPGDQGGPMTNGALYAGTITVGDLDAWSFTANAGDSVVVRVGALTGSYFNPWLRVYGPDGTLLGSVDSGSGIASEIALTATNSGTFTVLVSDGSQDGYGNTGTYQLNYVDAAQSFVVSPGDQGGPMTNGALYAGTITVGDLDAWSFTANAGDSVVVRVGALTGSYFNPWLRVYGPDGTLLGSVDSGSGIASEIALTATNSGTFTVLVSDGSQDGYGNTGTYQLNYVDAAQSFVVSPGDQGGPMTNGALYAGTITVGDLDAWSFTANAGDSVVVRVGALTGSYFNPWLRVYGPDGTLLGSVDSGSGIASEIALTATNSGTFTVLVSDGSQDGYGNTGTYQVNYVDAPDSFVVSPGDQGGPMTNGALYAGTITIGDLDAWSFTACTGDLLNLSLHTTGFNGYLELYGSNGALLKVAGNSTALSIAYTATNCGTFTVLVSSYSAGGTGTYQLSGTGLTAGLQLLSPTLSGTNLYLSGSGGGSNLLFVLYATTNLAQPFDLWTPILTNHFNASGAFDITNLYDPSQPQQFFRFLVP